MSTWITHLRIADLLLDKIDGLSEIDFIFGSIAPDSGVPNEDWSVYTPSSDISHFQSLDANLQNRIDIQKFRDKYYTKELAAAYNIKQSSFYLGYMMHLITDILWRDNVALPTQEKYKDKFKDINHFWKAAKKDWYDLDFLFLKRNPDFKAFKKYDLAAGYENVFMDEFSNDAFVNRRVYITNLYKSEHSGIERDYTYLTEQDMDKFVRACTDELVKRVMQTEQRLKLRDSSTNIGC